MQYAGLDAAESWKWEQQNQNHVLFSYLFDKLYKLYGSHSRSSYLFIILLKCFHLFKIVESDYDLKKWFIKLAQ